jgi:hypothetical protein
MSLTLRYFDGNVRMNTTLHYFGEALSPRGLPEPYFSYVLHTSVLLVGCVATIVSFSQCPGKEKLLLHHLAPPLGTEEDAIKVAESYLDRLHPGLHKRRT